MTATKLLVLCSVCACAAIAQEYRATLTGRILDAQGAVIPEARITATNQQTGARSDTTSGPDGVYTIPFLAPGAYTLTVEAPGFKKYVRQNLQLSTGERVGVDVQMEIGQASEAVTVSAEAPLLNTESATVGQVIGSHQVENMPLNGRTPLVLAQLAMGVTPNSDPLFSRPFDNAGPSDMSMGGAPSRTNELLTDGAPNTTGNSRVAYNPPIDSVDEVRVHTFEADAAYGHTGGGTVNVVLKSGSNDLHGTLYEFNQVSALAATPFFTNKAGLKKPVTRYNQYGANAGGPIWIPKVINGRNRLFWYLAWEGIKDSFPEPITTTVPTAAMRNGDFSELLKAPDGGKCAPYSCYQLFDPLTGVAQGSRIQRQPFEGNIIPASRLSPIAKAALQFYPLPNQPGEADTRNNYLANTVRSDGFDNELGRLDFNASDKHKLFWNFHHNDRLENRGNRFFNIATGNLLSRINWGSVFDDVYTFTPTTIMNVRLSWNRFVEANAKPSNGFDPTKLGLPAYLTTNSPKLVLPRFDFSGIESIGDTAGDRTPFDIFQIFGDVVKIVGNHSLKMGGDIREYRESSASYGDSAGHFTFRSNWTNGPLDNSPGAPFGQDVAAFMLGMPTSGDFQLNASRTNQAKYMAFFIQDDWRVRSNLSLNLGLRFERDFGTTERFNRTLVGFDTTTPSPIAPEVIAAYAASPNPLLPPSQFRVNGGPVFASSSNPNVYSTRPGYFSPRFGYAWTPAFLGGKTVLRGGAGVFVFPIGTTGINQPGFSRQTDLVATLDSYLTPSATLANPFPGGILRPTGASLGLATNLGQGITFYNSNPLNPYSVRWNFSIQHQFPGSMILETAYEGNHAVHLGVDSGLNPVPAQYLSTSPFRDQATIDRLTANVKNPFAGLVPGTSLNGSTIQLQNLLVPFPQFSSTTANVTSSPNGVAMSSMNRGSSYYHAFEVRVEKRYSHGLNLLANYIWSRVIERRNYLNWAIPVLEKRPADIDRPQRFVISGSYELPFGQGKPIAFSSKWANRLIGGFVINGIYNYQSGTPLTWGNLIYLGGDLHYNPRNVNDRAFDTTRFVTASNQQLSSNIRTFPTRFANLRQDPTNNVDASIIKNNRLSERINLQLRMEAFNALNHAVFAAPNLTATDSSFGRITGQTNLERRVQLGARLVW
jgi:hypothetical protein